MNASSWPARTQEVLKATFGVVRDNAEAAVQTNVRVFELWADVVRKNVAQGESLVRSVTAPAAKAA